MGKESQAAWIIDNGYDEILDSDWNERDEPLSYSWDEPEDEDEDEDPGYFQTFEDASHWAKLNVGKAITRAPDGKGFIIKE